MKEQVEIYGIRSIIEAIESSKDISKVYLLKPNSNQSSLFSSLLKLLERKSIKFSYVPKEKFRKFSDKNHQGAVAILSPVSLLSIEELLESSYQKDISQTYLLLDGITDTRNFGAIIRTSVAANISGIVIAQNNSAPINSEVVKASSGGVFKIPIARVSNLKDAIMHLNSLDIKIVGMSEKANKPIYEFDFTKSLAIILGSEDKGISKSIINLSNETLKIPISEKIDSLNVSVAFSAVAFEITRQRNY
ncbi:MAG: 23S rRNA (guanosine(2251)-2'-O)-methyltransferase RlmB [Candidatus Marisimplicoccus sp.]|tara:strand:- start:394 stop:1137 length:744 start_codon:yes stop_codon:yes gene_type:complete